MIRVDDVRFSYGRKGIEVLKGISFESEDNAVISILGPNGTGKTTFLKCMCGIYRPTSGTVTVDGTDIMSLSGRELAKRVGFVPQSVPVNGMSVFDTVLIGRKPYFEFAPSREDLAKVGAVIDGMGMSHLALKRTEEISGGEFQKTQIARALVQEPDVLVLDEPANNLDIANQHLTMRIIMDAVRTRRMCTIMTMHDINLALHYSDRFLFMKDGVVQAYGGPEIVTEDLIRRVYGFDATITEYRGLPLVLPAESERYLPEKHHSHGDEDMTDYTSVKKMMTEKMVEMYCRDLYGGDSLCGECAAMRDVFFAHLDACIYKDKGWPCMTCPKCCFEGADKDAMMAVSAHMQEWMAAHPEEATKFAPPHHE